MPNSSRVYRVIAEKTNAILRTKELGHMFGFLLLNFMGKTRNKEKNFFV